LRPPNKTWAVIGERVDFIQPGHEPCHYRAIERALDSANIDLSYVEFGHARLPPLIRVYQGGRRRVPKLKAESYKT
jgi:hypothetical protein